MLLVWWLAVHLLAIAGVLSSGLIAALKVVSVAALACHAALRRPPPPTTVQRLPDGGWSLPDRGLPRLTLRPGTSVGPFWILLRLASGGAGVAVLLLRDQLDAATWRTVQAELRRASAPPEI